MDPCGAAEVGPYLGRTTDVVSYQPNKWGFFYMHGNVSELCADKMGDYPTGSLVNPLGVTSSSGRVIRGGAWDGDGADLRSEVRYGGGPSGRGNAVGFRLSLRQMRK
jgi:formylglycine-generating enzyme